MFKRINRFFDKFEDGVRTRLSHHPVIYAFIGGFATVVFWRGVWLTMDYFKFMTPLVSIFLSTAVMLATGTFISFFIGESILMSGLKEEKRIDQKTERELIEEEARLKRIISEIDEIRKIVNEIGEVRKDVLEIKHKLAEKNKKAIY
jgi:uncharacterized protein YneF (UPF0154 family)